MRLCELNMTHETQHLHMQNQNPLSYFTSQSQVSIVLLNHSLKIRLYLRYSIVLHVTTSLQNFFSLKLEIL